MEEFKQWTFKKESGWFLWTRLDWNEILKVMNDDYERIEAALRLPTFAERKSTLQGIQAGFRRDTDHWKQGNHRAMILVSLEYRSRFAAVKIRDALMSEQVSFLDLATRSHTGFELSRTAVALAEWRLDHEPDGPMGRRPERWWCDIRWIAADARSAVPAQQPPVRTVTGESRTNESISGLP